MKGDELTENRPKSQFSDLYKNVGRPLALSQDERRELFLKQQKEKRHGLMDEKRDLSDLFSDVETVGSSFKKKKSFVFKLMESEWLTEIPDDLSENWLVKLCPEGQRYLVVAQRGMTFCYLKSDKNRPSFKFRSNFPGGNNDHYNRFTVLDCIYNSQTRTFFIFDVLAWNSLSLIDSEAQFRFFWLKSKFQEDAKLHNSERNFTFSIADFIPARLDLLQDFLFTPFGSNGIELKFEGVLFYHKEGLYSFGKTPLVGWLKCFMLAEKLAVDVPFCHVQTKPVDYVNIEQFLMEKKRNRRDKKDKSDNLVEMEEV